MVFENRKLENKEAVLEEESAFITAKLKIKLQPDSEIPLNRQLYLHLRDRINSLQLMPGEVLPSTRELASALNISRKTVTRAYEDLINQGFIYSKKGIGTFVKNRIPKHKNETQVTKNQNGSSIELSEVGECIINCSNTAPIHQGEIPELHFGATPKDLMPVKSWMKVLRTIAQKDSLFESDYDIDPFGYLPLRKAISGYLLRQRAIDCQPKQIIVFNNALSHLKLLSKLLIDDGDRVAIENPGFPFARRLFASQGAILHPVDVDEQGLIVDQIKNTHEKIKLLFITPSHQDPTGATFSNDRRLELIEWIQKTNCLVIEDDYDCEFQLQNLRFPSLMTMDNGNNIVYLGDFWKTLFPLVNIGFMILPPSLIDVFTKAQSLGWIKENTNIPHLESLTMTAFLNEGHYENYTAELQKNYASRYRNFVTGITQNFGTDVSLAKESGGMQMLLKVDPEVLESSILNAARKADVPLIPIQSYYFEKRVEKEYLVPFALYDESDMSSKIEKWRSAFNRSK